MKPSYPLISATLVAGLLTPLCAVSQRLYVGTFTSRGSQTAQGVYVADFDPDRGIMSPVRLAVRAADPSFLALDPARGVLFAVERPNLPDGSPGGAIAAYRMQPDGTLALINREDAGGLNPSHITLTPDGSHVISANYRGASLTVMPVAADGTLRPRSQLIPFTHHSIHPHRQAQPHPHAFNFSPQLGGRLGVATDEGGDRCYLYRFDTAAGRLMPLDPPWVEALPASGPRHFAFHPTLPVGYAINELYSTVGIYEVDAARPTLRYRNQVLALPRDFSAASTASEVVVHPSGKFVYASNRGHDSIAVFAVDAATGDLTPRGHIPSGGRTPRNFVCDPSGRWLLAANQDSDNVAIFAIDPATGALTPHGAPVAVATPTCLRFAPAGH